MSVEIPNAKCSGLGYVTPTMHSNNIVSHKKKFHTTFLAFWINSDAVARVSKK